MTVDAEAALDRANKLFWHYAYLASCRSMLDLEGGDGPADVAIVGNEAQVERQLRASNDVSATDLLALVFPVGEAQ